MRVWFYKMAEEKAPPAGDQLFKKPIEWNCAE